MFFFKQKTAYEMRISDWSSDVCSSDLEPSAVLAVLAIILAGKSVAAFGIVLAFGYPARTALTVSASLAQIGEFSFILIGLGVTLGLVEAEARDLVLAGALLSITLNPLVRSEEHTSELQSLMRISYAVFCLKKKKSIETIPTSVSKHTKNIRLSDEQ